MKALQYFINENLYIVRQRVRDIDTGIIYRKYATTLGPAKCLYSVLLLCKEQSCIPKSYPDLAAANGYTETAIQWISDKKKNYEEKNN